MQHVEAVIHKPDDSPPYFYRMQRYIVFVLQHTSVMIRRNVFSKLTWRYHSARALFVWFCYWYNITQNLHLLSRAILAKWWLYLTDRYGEGCPIHCFASPTRFSLLRWTTLYFDSKGFQRFPASQIAEWMHLILLKSCHSRRLISKASTSSPDKLPLSFTIGDVIVMW